MSRLYESEATRVFDAPRHLVWALVSDTNRADRALGLSPAKYRWEDQGGPRRVRVASASELGVSLEWVEPPYEWLEESFVKGGRRFTRGPAEAGGFSAELEDEPEGRTRLTARVWVTITGPKRLVLGPVQRLKFERGLARYFDGIERVCRDLQADPSVGGRTEPAAQALRQRLLVSPHDRVISGPRARCHAELLASRSARLQAARVPPAIVERLIAHLRDAPDDEVSQMKPFELARAWGSPRRDVLRAFLHATTVGLTDLRWQVNCPVCRVGASEVAELAALGGSSHCDACEIRYDTDFARHVEATFAIHPAIRSVTPALYCASSPAFLSHVFAQLRVDPGERRELSAELPTGELLIRVLGRPGSAAIELAHPPETLTASLVGGELSLRASGRALRTTRFVLENDGDEEAVVLLERTGWSADAVLGVTIASLPDFLRLFATEAPAAGLDLRVGHVAILFSDLVGSTSLYERVGDARAYALVEEHFRLCERVVDEAGGAVVKTMGDSIMASFPSLREAMSAALGMVAAHDAAHPDGDLGLKIGLQAGPCLAVRANDRFDFFGTTVNTAARLQGRASASEIVLTREAYDDPAVAALVRGLSAVEFQATLKGLETKRTLVAVRCARAADGREVGREGKHERGRGREHERGRGREHERGRGGEHERG